MNPMIPAKATITATAPDRIELAPSSGPTVRCSSTVISAGSAPARSRIASCDDSSGVKLPVMIPEPPEMCAWITGAEITCSSSTIANGLPMFSAVYCAEGGAARRVEAEAHRRPVVLVEARLCVDELVAGHHRAPVEHVEDPLLVHRRQHQLVEPRLDAGVAGPVRHRVERQPRGLADHGQQLLGRADPRHLHEDAVRALPLDRRLAGAGLVDAAADDLEALLHRPLVDRRLLRLGQRHHDRVALGARLELAARPAGQREDRLRRAPAPPRAPPAPRPGRRRGCAARPPARRAAAPSRPHRAARAAGRAAPARSPPCARRRRRPSRPAPARARRRAGRARG